MGVIHAVDLPKNLQAVRLHLEQLSAERNANEEPKMSQKLAQRNVIVKSNRALGRTEGTVLLKTSGVSETKTEQCWGVLEPRAGTLSFWEIKKTFGKPKLQFDLRTLRVFTDDPYEKAFLLRFGGPAGVAVRFKT